MRLYHIELWRKYAINYKVYYATFSWLQYFHQLGSIFSCRLAGKLWSSILLSSFSFSFKNVYPLASYVWMAQFFWSIILVQKCFNMLKLAKLVQTCSNLFKLVQTCSNLFKIVQTFSNMFKLVQIFSNMFKLVQTCSKLFKPVQTCSKFF